jgi:hypothetical protein
MNINEFLSRLDFNLETSINTFQTIPKNGVGDLEGMYESLQSVSKKLYTYLDLIKKLETIYFSNTFINNEQFILSFEEESGLNSNAEIWKKMKDSMTTAVNIHKLKESNRKKALENIQNVDITILDSCNISPNKITVPVIKHLKSMTPMFYWYHGDKVYKKGIYICLSEGVYIKVPFPSTVVKDDDNYKINSVPCKYETKDLCTAHKKKISEIYNSEIRTCNFVHKNEKFSKLSAVYKCSKESLGNHETIIEDLNSTNINDIKRILMYALSDTLLSTIWFQNKSNKKEVVLQNIEYY